MELQDLRRTLNIAGVKIPAPEILRVNAGQYWRADLDVEGQLPHLREPSVTS